jgi:mannose PTS system EIID component
MSALPISIKARVFFRSLFIQAGFSPGAMQTLGLLYALEPALDFLYPNQTERDEAIARHMAPFNTHPYVATGLIGGILLHEQRIAQKLEPSEAVSQFKERLAGPLAALGDGFFWLSLRPAVGAFCAFLTPFISFWAPVVFIGLYNAVHLAARWWLFQLCLTRGESVVGVLAKAKIPAWSKRLRVLAILFAGALSGILAFHFGLDAGTLSGLPSTLASLVGASISVWLFKERQVKPLYLLYGVAALAILAGAFG